MSDTTLSAAQQRFILHWGEMGARWGINRTVAQVHALLYLSPRPLQAEEIAAALSVARSNVSTSLRELQGWGLIKVVHILGGRKDHFESLKDVWRMFEIVVAERKRREVDPTIAMLRDLVLDKNTDDYTQKRLEEMLSFFDAMTACYRELERLPSGALPMLVPMRGKLKALLTGSKKG